MHLKKDSLGRSEIVGSGEFVGSLFGKSFDEKNLEFVQKMNPTAKVSLVKDATVVRVESTETEDRGSVRFLIYYKRGDAFYEYVARLTRSSVGPIPRGRE